MTTLVVLVSIIATVSCGGVEDTTTLAPVTLSPEQIALNQMCDECVGDCIIPSTEDCHFFLKCTKGDTGTFHADKMICSISTYIDADGKCKSSDEVACPKNYCVGKASGTKVPYPDNFCSTYMECDGEGNEMAMCCDSGNEFDSSTSACVPNATCNDCPLHDTNSTCTTSGVNADNHCGTYDLCINSLRFPTCCTKGNVYNQETFSCEPADDCPDSPCPEGYLENKCESNGLSYQTTPAYCGTYMTCNGTILVEYRCCLPGQSFDVGAQKCVESDGQGCEQECPKNSIKDECPLMAVPDKAGFYQRKKQDSKPGPCAPGTFYSSTACACAGLQVNPSDNSCSMDVIMNMTFPYEEQGTAFAYVQEYGMATKGAEWNGRQTTQFGNCSYAVPYLKSSLPSWYFKAVFKADEAPQPGQKMVLSSNCKFSTSNKKPSFEVCLLENEVIIQGFVEDSEGKQSDFSIATGYQTGVFSSVTAAYDGSTLWVTNSAGGSEPSSNLMALEGIIPQASSDTTFGACMDNGVLKSAFKGSIALIEMAKCVKEDWVKTMLETK